ncbi:MAG: FecR family protein [Bacillota bacterium]|nr:FecR family protein [Bacillota bacterium]
MKTTRPTKVPPLRPAVGLALLAGFLLGSVWLAAAAESGKTNPAGESLAALPPGVAAVVRAVSGDARWSTQTEAVEWQALRPQLLLPAGALIRTGPGASVDLELGPDRRVRLTGGSVVVVAPPALQAGDSHSLFLYLGRVWVNLRRELLPGERFTVETPAAVVGVRGTLFTVLVTEDKRTVAAVHRGKVEVTGAGVTVTVGAGNQVVVAFEGRPEGPGPLSSGEREAAQRERAWFEAQGEKVQDESDQPCGQKKTGDGGSLDGKGSGGSPPSSGAGREGVSDGYGDGSGSQFQPGPAGGTR